MGHERDYVHSVDVGGLDRAAELTQISRSRLVSTSTSLHQYTYKHANRVVGKYTRQGEGLA